MTLIDPCNDHDPVDLSGWLPCPPISIGDVTVDLGTVSISGPVEVITPNGPIDVTGSVSIDGAVTVDGTVNAVITELPPTLEVECLCDVQADGSVVTFTRAHLITAPGGVISSTLLGQFTDSTLATPYATTGTVGSCDLPGDDALFSGLEFVERCDVQADGSVVHFVRAYFVTLTDAGATSTQIGTGWTSQGMQAPYVPTGVEQPCSNCPDCPDDGTTGAPELADIRFTCRCDQQANGTVVSFTRAYAVAVDNGVPTVTEIGSGWTDDTLRMPYVLTGTEVDCGSVGDDVFGVQARKETLAAGGTWSAPMLTQTVSVAVVGDGATFTDSAGTVEPLLTGRVYTWHAVGDDHVIGTPFIIDAGSADVEITYTILAAN